MFSLLPHRGTADPENVVLTRGLDTRGLDTDGSNEFMKLVSGSLVGSPDEVGRGSVRSSLLLAVRIESSSLFNFLWNSSCLRDMYSPVAFIIFSRSPWTVASLLEDVLSGSLSWIDGSDGDGFWITAEIAISVSSAQLEGSEVMVDAGTQ